MVLGKLLKFTRVIFFLLRIMYLTLYLGSMPIQSHGDFLLGFLLEKVCSFRFHFRVYDPFGLFSCMVHDMDQSSFHFYVLIDCI